MYIMILQQPKILSVCELKYYNVRIPKDQGQNHYITKNKKKKKHKLV